MTKVRNWQELSRAIVKFIRDQYGIEEAMLRRTATLEEDLGLGPEQLEQILDYISEAFEVRFPETTLDEVVRLEELCLLTCWLRGFFKQPPFLSDGFIGHCRAINPRATPLV